MKLLSLDEVCKVLRVKRRHLQNMRKYPDFPRPINMGISKVMFREEDIQNFIDNGGLHI